MDFTRESSLVLLGNAQNIAEVVLSGVCHRYPDLKFVSVENGAGWLPFLAESMDWQWLNVGAHKDYPERLLPSEYLYRQVYGMYWFERDAGRAVIDKLADNLMFETDFPHATSLSPGPASESPSPRDVIEQARSATWTTRSPARCCSTRRRGCTSSIRRPARERRAGRRHRRRQRRVDRRPLRHPRPRAGADLHRTLARARAECPVARSDAYEGGYWVATKYEDVLRIAQDWETWSNQLGITVGPAGTGEGLEGVIIPPVSVDPPLQRTFRRLINRYFTPTAVAPWEPPTRALVAP